MNINIPPDFPLVGRMLIDLYLNDELNVRYFMRKYNKPEGTISKILSKLYKSSKLNKRIITLKRGEDGYVNGSPIRSFYSLPDWKRKQLKHIFTRKGIIS